MGGKSDTLKEAIKVEINLYGKEEIKYGLISVQPIPFKKRVINVEVCRPAF